MSNLKHKNSILSIKKQGYMKNFLIERGGVMPDKALLAEAHRSEKPPGMSCHNSLVSARMGAVLMGP